VGVCAPRQNGKNGILEVRELVGARLLGEKLQIHSAHLADTSKEGFRRLDEVLEANEWLSKDVKHIWRTNGHESIEFRDGNRIRFRTRTRGGGRGFSGSPVILDEAMFLPEVSMGSILPVVSAQSDPQIWYTGSAVDQTIHEDGVAFSRLRDRALKGSDDRLAFSEWSFEADDPGLVHDEVINDPAVWAAANPALGIRITPEYIHQEIGELEGRTFAVERLCVGDWPDPQLQRSVIDMLQWGTLTDSTSAIADGLVFAFDVSPDRQFASVSVAGRRADGFGHVEMTDRREGTDWIVERLTELNVRHKPERVVFDAVGPAGSLEDELRKAGVPVEAVTTEEHADACGMFYDAVANGELRHLGQPELRNALKGAKTRALGDRWAWSRRNSGVDITPLVSSTLAHWGSATLSPAREPMVAFA
jgi:phage terminase large subunit-like protein